MADVRPRKRLKPATAAFPNDGGDAFRAFVFGRSLLTSRGEWVAALNVTDAASVQSNDVLGIIADYLFPYAHEFERTPAFNGWMSDDRRTCIPSRDPAQQAHGNAVCKSAYSLQHGRCTFTVRILTTSRRNMSVRPTDPEEKFRYHVHTPYVGIQRFVKPDIFPQEAHQHNRSVNAHGSAHQADAVGDQSVERLIAQYFDRNFLHSKDGNAELRAMVVCDSFAHTVTWSLIQGNGCGNGSCINAHIHLQLAWPHAGSPSEWYPVVGNCAQDSICSFAFE